MDELTKEKFTEVTDRIIIKCQRNKILPEDFLVFYNYFLFLKTDNFNLIDAVLLAKALVGANISFNLNTYALREKILNVKQSMENYILEMTGKDYTISR